MHQEHAAYQTFKRLLRDFTRPYVLRLVGGIVAGFLVGGSLFGSLLLAPNVIKPLEANVKIKQSQQVQPSEEAEKSEDGVVAYLKRLRRQFDLVREGKSEVTWDFVLVAVSGLLFFVFIRLIAVFMNRYLLRWVAARSIMDMRIALFDSLQQQSLKFYSKIDVGQLIGRCVYDTAQIENAIASTVADLVRAPFEIAAAAAFVIIAALEYDLTVVVILLFIVFPLCVLPVLILGRYVKRYAQHAMQRIGNLVSRMQENFTGIRVVKAYHMEEQESKRFRDMSMSYFKAIIRGLRAELFMTPLMEFVAVVLGCAFLIVCLFKGVRLYQIIPISLAAIAAYKPTKQLAKINVSIQRTVAAAERIFAILDTDTSLPQAQNPVIIDSFTDKIAFDNVSFKYDELGPGVLTEISFEMHKGSVVAFVGETGSGKTTIANLVARFYDPVKGRILLDGHDLRNVEIASLRRLIGIVTQETILFNDTVANNIRYGSENASMEDIIKAAKQANAHDFIVQDPEGYDRIVGEKGFVLSGGQRQRISIARAILKNPPVLILDEATSALDTATEKLVQEAINHVMEDRTVFAIAHRLSTIKHADQIFVLDEGRIIEQGNHEQLYARNGRYRKLCDMQFS